MHWKDYRLARTRVATGDADGPRRVLELLDGRMLVERDGAPSQIVAATFEEAKTLALELPRGAAPAAALLVTLPTPEPVSWWRRLWRWRWLRGAS